jgi:hypothetical protein
LLEKRNVIIIYSILICSLYQKYIYQIISDGKASTFSFHGAKSIQECIDPSRSSLDFAVQIKEKAAKDFHVEHENGNADAIDGTSRQESGQYEVVTFLTSSDVLMLTALPRVWRAN